MEVAWKDIRSCHEIMIEIIKRERPTIIAEIGIWKCSLLKDVLRSCGDIVVQYWGIDFWRPSDSYEEFESDMKRYVRTTKENWDRAYLYACRLMQEFPQLHIVRASSVEASKLFPLGYFDLVFIDADHRYPGILSDIKAWLPLVRTNGLLTGHDYKIAHPGVIQAVDECFDERKKIIEDSSVWIKKI